ncbi:OTU-like cysteine protease [Onchocerca flexuosa]|uniref:ubiquitinyl hydrolase 1 n=1 Tax=Onchocerca flexuosa TaxID=387005 RepID=A0A238BQ95_9BILA|nr:OTU-like cysteine protease [Onchocerca flexuosa]
MLANRHSFQTERWAAPVETGSTSQNENCDHILLIILDCTSHDNTTQQTEEADKKYRPSWFATNRCLVYLKGLPYLEKNRGCCSHTAEDHYPDRAFSSNRTSAMHSYRHTGTNSNNEEKRRANNAIASCKNTSLPRNASIKNNHSLGVSSPETNKQPRQSPSEENPADQIYGDEEMHDDVRRLCMDYMEKNSDHFSQFVTEDFHDYIARKRRRDAHGNHVELQAISEIFSRPIEIYEYCTEPRNISSSRLDSSPSGEPNPPIRLSYHGAVHYNSVVDPTKATVGVGLGLPEYSPGAADRNLLQEAMQKSEVQMIEDAMLHDKIKMTDFERTEQDISEQIARQSYLDYLKSISKTESAEVKETAYAVSEPGCSHTNIRPQESSANEWFHAAGSDAEESALLAQVMALSQQEFLNSLTKKSSKEQNNADQADGMMSGCLGVSGWAI